MCASEGGVVRGRPFERTGRCGEADACQGKEAFTDRQLAARVAKRKSGRAVYRCPHCHQYHVGTRITARDAR